MLNNVKQCQGITKKHKQCKKMVKEPNETTQCFCSMHKTTNKRVYEKEPCPVCFENNVECILDCGHWVHKECIILSGKAECPICRCKVSLNKTETKKINKRKKEFDILQIREDEQELEEQFIRGFVQSLYNPEDNALGVFLYELLQDDSFSCEFEILFEDNSN
jgi:hypothetical protein